jgi:hypothetical protein
MFNEGVDIPQIDTVLFLRPTDSLTIFLQQIGRGLRLHDGKDYLTILDFVGNSNPEYDFEHKFRAMIGKTHISIKDEIETDFPHLPLGCSIVLERRAKDIIISNIKRATSDGLRKLVKKIKNFNNNYTLPLNISNLLKYENLELINVYKSKNTWGYLLNQADLMKDFIATDFDTQIGRMLGTTWLSTDSITYFEKIKSFLNNEEIFEFKKEETQIFVLMLFYDIFQDSPRKIGYSNAIEGVKDVFKNNSLKKEVLIYLDIRINQCECIEKSYELGFQFPLKVHGRYTRSQILVALQLNTVTSRFPSQSGVAFSKKINTEALFITLDKSEGDYSPSTMYEDYAITEMIFHWQSQNSTKPESIKGLSYINHLNDDKIILLFVREKNIDENGLTMAYVFLGLVNYISHEGSQPMSIKWYLEEPIPPTFYNEARKLAVG